MKLLYDDLNQIYVWVDDYNEDDELSPHFDYEEDAELWYQRMKQELKWKKLNQKSLLDNPKFLRLITKDSLIEMKDSNCQRWWLKARKK